MCQRGMWAALWVYILLGGSVNAEQPPTAEQPTSAAEAQTAQGSENVAAVVGALELMVRELRAELGAMRAAVNRLEIEERLATLETALTHEVPATAQVGYGNRNWVNTNRVATCRGGTYVSGIRVEYGGTCLNQCDADGGTIRNVVLTCSELPIRPRNDR